MRACAVSSLHGGELLFLSKHISRAIVLLVPRSQYVPHPTPHVPLLASWRFLRWSSNCDALLEIIHIIIFVVSIGAVCIFSRTDRSWARLYRVYPKSAAIECTQKLLCGYNANSLFFRASFFCSCPNKNEWPLRPVAKITCPCATPLGTYFPVGILVPEYTFIHFFTHFYFPASGQAAFTGVVPSFPRFLPSIFVAHRVQQSHCSPIFIECC